jgi:hypothetical protein
LRRSALRWDNLVGVKLRLAVTSAAALGLLGVADVAGAPVSARAVAAHAQSVTLNFVRLYSNACNCYQARVSGQVASSSAGEEVVVLRQYCGRSAASASAVGQALTRAGGFWATELPIVSRPDALVSESYRARWNGQFSAPVTFRGKLAVSRARVSPSRSRISVFTTTNNPVNLKGRQIVLQRKVGDSWTRIATARLTPHRVKYYTFVATFTVPRRGWTLRALVPARSATPCFTASVSEEWRS